MLKTVVFDIGNVLLQWDPNYLYEKLIPDAQERAHFLSEILPPSWNVEQDRGRAWPEAEAERIAIYPQYADLIRAYRARWLEMVPGLFPENVAVLEALIAKGVPVYAITNFAADTFIDAQRTYPCLTLFKGIVVSGTEGVIKPDPAIFELFLARYDQRAQECLFIDDSIKNVTAAAALGFTTIHVTPDTNLSAAVRAAGFAI